LLRDVRVFLAKCHKHGNTIFANGVIAELSFGISVGDSTQYVASLDFTASELRDLTDIGIGLNFTAYPTSDEVNEVGKVA
jgi:hypothetical protein